MNSVTAANLHEVFGSQFQENVILAPNTSARIGGPADILVTVRNRDELARAVQMCWEANLPMTLLGGGSNVLVSDLGVRGVVVLNKAKATEFRPDTQRPTVWAESGVILTNLAHRAAALGYSGLEWAATVPGTTGGAVYGNAGAYGSDIAHNLQCAEILLETGREWWPVEKMEYGYRSSIFKHTHPMESTHDSLSKSFGKAVILSAEFGLQTGNAEQIKAEIEKFTSRRKESQPPGASMGSMFKNPPGDFAGRLIEAAGLKGTRIGNAEISNVHGNFFVNHGDTRAADIKALIVLAQKTIKENFGIDLQLEVELIGEWK